MWEDKCNDAKANVCIHVVFIMYKLLRIRTNTKQKSFQYTIKPSVKLKADGKHPPDGPTTPGVQPTGIEATTTLDSPQLAQHVIMTLGSRWHSRGQSLLECLLRGYWLLTVGGDGWAWDTLFPQGQWSESVIELEEAEDSTRVDGVIKP